MLTKVEVDSQIPGVGTLSLDLLDPTDNQIHVRDIEGLGPVKADIATTPYSDDGELYQGSSKGKRNIVMKLGLNPSGLDQRMSTLRHILYKYFGTQSRVVLRFFSDDMPTVEIMGYSESLEPNIFSKDPEIQVSVLCPNPDFVSVNVETLTGTIYPETVMSIEYDGDVPTGFEITADIVDMVGGISDLYADNYVITMTYAGESKRIKVVLVDTSSQYDFYLSSLRGFKRVRYIHKVDGSIQNITRRIYDPSFWPLLWPGTNQMSTRVDRHQDAPPMDTSIRNWVMTYRNRYGGL